MHFLHSVERLCVQIILTYFHLYLSHLLLPSLLLPCRSVFDTQVAYAQLRDEGLSQGMVGLAPLLSHFSAPEGKGEDMVKIKHDLSQYDWRIRPLPLHTLHYAQMDVHLLIPVAYIIILELIEKEKEILKSEVLQSGVTHEEMRAHSYKYADTSHVDMVFFESQANAGRLWTPREAMPRATAFVNYSENPFAGTVGEGGPEGGPEGEAQEPDPSAGGEATDTALAAESGAGAEAGAGTTGTSGSGGTSAANRALHVHVSGSRAKLGHDLKTRRRSTRNKRGAHGSVPWRTDVQLLVAQRLMEWRDLIGRELDESPSFVLTSVLLLKIAEKQAKDLNSLYQVWSPLPPLLLKIERECTICNARETQGDTAQLESQCRCLTATVKLAVEEYHTLIQEFKLEAAKQKMIEEVSIANEKEKCLLEEGSSPKQNQDSNIAQSGFSSSSSISSSTSSDGKVYALFATCVTFVLGVSIDYYFADIKK
jgi:ribonuclease D